MTKSFDQDTYQRIKSRLLRDLEFMGDADDADIKETIDKIISSDIDSTSMPISVRLNLSRQLFSSIRRLDILQELIDDPQITEVMINGCEDIFIERCGRISRCEKRFESEEKLMDVLQQIVAKCNRVINDRSPIVDARLKDGSRVNAIISPVALNGPIISIRKFPDKPITMHDLISLGSISSEAADLLSRLVRERYSVLISGGTSAGKTTFLNALSAFIPKNERIITIEDNAELKISGIENLVRLEAKASNTDGSPEISIRDLIKCSLRQRPDRIIVGECRGAEAFDMLQALNTGHDGSMSTLHANSSKDALLRLETMVLMGFDLPLRSIRSQICSGIDIIIHLGRLPGGTRKVLEISEVMGLGENEIETSMLYSYDLSANTLVKQNELSTSHRTKYANKD